MSDVNDVKENELYVLFKRGERAHIHDLLYNGRIYINTVDALRKFDKNPDRTDPDDSIYHREYRGTCKLTICPSGADINICGIKIDAHDSVIKTNSLVNGNIYCFSGIYTQDLLDETDNVIFDTKSLGDIVIVIHNPHEFVIRINKALKDNGFNDVRYQPVEYYTNYYVGEVGIFKKHEKFKHQKEFRFFIDNPKNEVISFEIGSIEDIAVVEDSFTLKFDLTDGRMKTVIIPSSEPKLPK